MGANNTRAAWSDDEQRRLNDAIGELGVGNWHAIAERVGGGRTACACAGRYYNPKRAARFADIGAIDRKVPAYVIAERDRARNAESRSITAEHFGDPLPGRSALDRKLRGEIDTRRIANPYKPSALLTTTRPVAQITLYWGETSADEARA